MASSGAAWGTWFEGMLAWIRSFFFKQEMELTLVGLQNSGKTTLVNVVAVRASRPGRCDALTNVLLCMCAVAAADGWLL